MQTEAKNRVARLKRMGIADARVSTVKFAGVNAEQVEATLRRQNMRMKVLMFTNYGRSYVISFTATIDVYSRYWAIAKNALKTFKCIPPPRAEVVASADKERIQKEEIPFWIKALAFVLLIFFAHLLYRHTGRHGMY